MIDLSTLQQVPEIPNLVNIQPKINMGDRKWTLLVAISLLCISGILLMKHFKTLTHEKQD
jgi:hypothetical protein